MSLDIEKLIRHNEVCGFVFLFLKVGQIKKKRNLAFQELFSIREELEKKFSILNLNKLSKQTTKTLNTASKVKHKKAIDGSDVLQFDQPEPMVFVS